MASQNQLIAVFMGGPSPEYDVSLKSGQMVAQALAIGPYDVWPVTIGRGGEWHLKENEPPVTLGVALDRLRAAGTAAVFMAIHGAWGEDGTIQGCLEAAGIPYTGSGILASALAMDKPRAADLFSQHGLLVPRQLVVAANGWRERRGELAQVVTARIAYPCVVKPVGAGSSVGVTIVSGPRELAAALESAWVHDRQALIQEYVAGTEVTCAILDDGWPAPLTPLPPTQITPRGATFFDYRAKYEPGGSEELTPAPLPATLLQKIQAIALDAHRILGCAGLSRTDMILRDGSIFVLETNTAPGMTETSLLPQAAAAAGISFPNLVARIVNAALQRARRAAHGQ